MNPHFRAFSFVDRIVRLELGVGASGTYSVPAAVKDFPISLAAEAVGQLAAWAAMAAMNFEYRPVAGIAGKVELLSTVQPGAVLDLSVSLQTTENDAAVYGGEARVEGQPVVRLENCVGPMVEVREFDDPASVRARFELLCNAGCAPGGFEGIPEIPLVRTVGDRGKSLGATLTVPETAAFFGDHFPRRPVFPGTLLIQANLELASGLAAELDPPAVGGFWRPSSLTNVKLRSFVSPRDTLEMEAKVAALGPDATIISVETRRQNRLAGSARVLLKPGEVP
jgi:3-hydroxymyristoyl/3-hydroxydecanoyl-(acyl carrier protein) dehydratase